MEYFYLGVPHRLSSRHWPRCNIKDSKYFHLATEETRSGTETALWAYSRTLTNVALVKYIDPLSMAMDYEILEVVANLWNLQRE